MVVDALLAKALAAWTLTRDTPLQVWLTIAALLIAAYFGVRLFAAAFFLFVFPHSKGQQHPLTVITSDHVTADAIWMNVRTIKELKLSAGDALRLGALDRDSRRGSRLVRLRYRLSGLADNEIELSRNLQRALFKRTLEDGSLKRFVFSPRIPKGGFQEFWFNPNEQLKYQNRFNATLALVLTVFQLILAWMMAPTV